MAAAAGAVDRHLLPPLFAAAGAAAGAVGAVEVPPFPPQEDGTIRTEIGTGGAGVPEVEVHEVETWAAVLEAAATGRACRLIGTGPVVTPPRVTGAEEEAAAEEEEEEGEAEEDGDPGLGGEIPSPRGTALLPAIATSITDIPTVPVPVLHLRLPLPPPRVPKATPCTLEVEGLPSTSNGGPAAAAAAAS